MQPFTLTQTATVAGISFVLDSETDTLSISGHQVTLGEIPDLVELLEYVHDSGLASFPVPPDPTPEEPPAPAWSEPPDVQPADLGLAHHDA